MADLYLALLLFLPLPLPERPDPYLHEALVRLATDLDLSTPSEGWDKFPLQSGILWTRQTLLDLADAPPSSDAARFPGWGVARAQLESARAYVWWLEERKAFYSSMRDQHEEAQTETHRLIAVWYAVAQIEHGGVKTRRLNLLALKCLLGADDYGAGVLPPVLPLDRMPWR